MQKYPKIQTVFLRDPETKYKTLLEGQYAKPEFEYLRYNEWLFTEKVDGTNIRIGWNGSETSIGGKTDNAQIPSFLISRLQEIANNMGDTFGLESTDVCLYGEGYGAKIQKGGGNYIPDGVDFILFDVFIGGIWLERNNVKDIAHSLEVKIVPILAKGTLLEAIECIQVGIWSQVGDRQAEGLVMRPSTELFNRRGERIITKIKHKDYPDYKPTGSKP